MRVEDLEIVLYLLLLQIENRSDFSSSFINYSRIKSVEVRILNVFNVQTLDILKNVLNI